MSTKRTLIAVIIFLALATPVLALKGIEYLATRKAEGMMLTLKGTTSQQTIINVARWTASNSNFDRQLAMPWYFGYAFLLSHRYMPKPFRIHRGALPIFLMGGPCNNLSAVLELLFSTIGMEAIQHDLVAPGAGHSATSVKVDGEWIYIDPFYGVTFMEEGRLISLWRLKELVSQGHNPGDFIIRLRETANSQLYNQIATTAHSLMGEPMEIQIRLPLDGNRLIIGQLDGQWSDMADAGAALGATTHLHYVGPRYSREWTFNFVTDRKDAPSGFQIIFHFTEPVDSTHLPNSNVPARIEGRRLIYETEDPRSGIRLYYGNMKWNLERLLKRRSWYNVDMIEVTALAKPMAFITEPPL